MKRKDASRASWRTNTGFLAARVRSLLPLPPAPKCGARLRGARAGLRCKAPCMRDPRGGFLGMCRLHGGAALLARRRYAEERRKESE